MGIFDDVVVNAKSAAETVGKTAGKFVDVSKLKINLAEINGEISKRKQLLGEYVYTSSRDGVVDNAELAGKIAEIDELYAQAESINKALLDKQNKSACPNCGKLSSSTASFCSICGTKLPVSEAAKPVQPQDVQAPQDGSWSAADQSPNTSDNNTPDSHGE